MAEITEFYPCNQTPNDRCNLCNYVQNPSDLCTSTLSDNGDMTSAADCSVYCDAGCNSLCNQPQTLCATEHQFIKDHANVGGYPGEEIRPNDIIKDKWTPAFWNSLIDKLNTAERVGKIFNQGAGLSMTDVAAPQPITAKLYNDLNSKLCRFNVTYNQVAQNSLITAAVANAIKTAYENATFDTTVCDVCNTDQSIHQQDGLPNCGCNCTCGCSCSCGCNCSDPDPSEPDPDPSEEEFF